MSGFNQIVFRLVLLTMLTGAGVLGHNVILAKAEEREVRVAHEALNSRIRQLEQENLLLEQERDRLASDMSYYEQLGREFLGLVKEDEKVYIVNLP